MNKKRSRKKRLREVLARDRGKKAKPSPSERAKLAKLAAKSSTHHKSVILHYQTDDALARGIAESLIESGKTFPFDNRYSARKDRAHVPGQQDHVHLLLKGKEACVINVDGTPSHNSDISRIPRYLHPHLEKLGVKISETVFIVESADV
jgi:hypothetical protein